ncbi:MAG: hypothetical protein VYE15_01035, partial [Myxococcota bacterium]|nr:hypothetical protein [Myxococcota bacterium]
MGFTERVDRLPVLGLGVSTEYGAGASPTALNIADLRRRYPQYAGFLEVGVEVSRGVDEDVQAWVNQDLPTTYHFLDVNLDEPEDLGPHWLDQVKS